jgi:hypothetical protein
LNDYFRPGDKQPSSGFVEDDNGFVFDYPIDDDGFDDGQVLKGYRGKEKQVKIPDGTTRIGHDAFLDKKFITSITIPDSVTEIGD